MQYICGEFVDWRILSAARQPGTLSLIDPVYYGRRPSIRALEQRIGGKSEHCSALRYEDKDLRTWPIPSGGGVVRHMVSTPEGDLYIACSGRNKVGVVKTPQ